MWTTFPRPKTAVCFMCLELTERCCWIVGVNFAMFDFPCSVEGTPPRFRKEQAPYGSHWAKGWIYFQAKDWREPYKGNYSKMKASSGFDGTESINLTFVCLVGVFFTDSSLPWDENHHSTHHHLVRIFLFQPPNIRKSELKGLGNSH